MNVQTLMDAVNNDPELNRRGKYYSIHFRVEMDDRDILFQIDNGLVTAIEEGADKPAAFALSGPRDAWRAFFEPVPPPEYHDLSAMIDRGHIRLEGNPMPWLGNMLYIKGVIDHWKAADGDI